MVASAARNTATNTVPAATSLELVAPAACSSSGSFDAVPAGAIAVAESSDVGAGGAPDASGTAAAGAPVDGSAAGVVVVDTGEVSPAGGLEPSPAAPASHGLGRSQTLGIMPCAWPRNTPMGLGASLDAAQMHGAWAWRKPRSWEQQEASVAEPTPKT